MQDPPAAVGRRPADRHPDGEARSRHSGHRRADVFAIRHAARPVWSHAAVCTRNLPRRPRCPKPTQSFSKLRPGSPAFVVRRITSDARGPYEFTVSTMRGDRYEIRSKLHI